MKKFFPLLAGIIAASALLLGGATVANAHGYVSEPYSRANACKLGLNKDCGAVQYEPQSLEAPKGFPAIGPADGKLPSAGGQFGGILDQQTTTRWYKNKLNTGAQKFTWTYTAPHATSQWRYYMTKPGWPQNAPLTRAALDLIGTVNHNGSAASTNLTHTVNIPTNRSGYHVIYAVWDVADTTNAFYNAIDVDVQGGAAARAIDRSRDVTGLSAEQGLELLAQRPDLSNSELARGVFATRPLMNARLQNLVRDGYLARPAAD